MQSLLHGCGVVAVSARTLLLPSIDTCLACVVFWRGVLDLLVHAHHRGAAADDLRDLRDLRTTEAERHATSAAARHAGVTVSPRASSLRLVGPI